MRMPMHKPVHSHIYVFPHVYTHAYTHAYARLYTQVYTHLYLHIPIRKCIHLSAHASMHMSMHTDDIPIYALRTQQCARDYEDVACNRVQATVRLCPRSTRTQPQERLGVHHRMHLRPGLHAG